MFAVIPHPTEALILSRTQKATLSRLNAEAGNSRWVPIFPLWAFFNNFDYSAAESDTTMQTGGDVNTAFDATQLKTIRNAIASFTIDRPEISNGEFFFPAVLRFRNRETVHGKILAGKKPEDDADSPRACENEKKLFARFPYSCSVFRIADAEIGERKTANDENAADKIAGKCTEDTSANSGDTDDAELRTWRVHTSLWVKTERIQR
nr:hypothetical protein [Treponema socranskii]